MMEAKKFEIPAADPNKFDLRTHIWDARGHLVQENLYRLHNRNGNNYYERPVNSGNLWTEGNQPCGRVELTFGPDGKIAEKKFNFDAPHIAYTPPLTGDDKLHYELEQARARGQELERELQAIRKEREMLEAVKQGMPAATAKSEVPTLKKPGVS